MMDYSHRITRKWLLVCKLIGRKKHAFQRNKNSNVELPRLTTAQAAAVGMEEHISSFVCALGIRYLIVILVCIVLCAGCLFVCVCWMAQKTIISPVIQ